MKSQLCLCVLAALACAPAGAADLAPVTLAWAPNPQTPQIDVAIARGFFRDAGLDVKTVSFPTGREAFEALAGGQVDVAFMAELPATIGALRAQPFAVVADLSRYRGSRLIANAKTLDMKTTADAAGKKVGLTIGANLDYFTSRLFAAAKINVTIVNASPPDLLPALLRGDIDIAVPFPTFYPAAAKALGENYREVLPGGYAVHNIVAASSPFIKMKPAELEKFIAALVKADAIVRAGPAAAQALVAENLKGAFTLESVTKMWGEYDFHTELADDLTDLLVDQGAWLIEKGAVKGAAPTAASMRPYIAEAALRKADASAVRLK